MFPTELKILQTDYSKLAPGDQAFALSLLLQLGRKGDLSPRQWPFVKKLADRITGAGPAPDPLGDLQPLLGLFSQAATRIKYPALLLRCDPVGPIKLWVAGPRASHPGSLSVATTGSAPGGKAWLGRIRTDGIWQPGNTVPADTQALVLPVLRALLADPQTALAEHGKQLGRCCYCGVTLSDDRSVAVGYGPTCARNWGLPWGERTCQAVAV